MHRKQPICCRFHLSSVIKIFKPLAVIFFSVIANTSFAQDTIHWSPCYQLKFEDFKGTPDTTKIDLANSYIKIGYNYDIVNNQLQSTVTCYFQKDISWAKHSMAVLMEHEQCHFDIAKLFALKLEQKFRDYKITNPGSVNYDLTAIYNSILKEKTEMDNLFDKIEKENSNTDLPQKKIEADIKKQLPTCKKILKTLSGTPKKRVKHN